MILGGYLIPYARRRYTSRQSRETIAAELMLGIAPSKHAVPFWSGTGDTTMIGRVTRYRFQFWLAQQRNVFPSFLATGSLRPTAHGVEIELRVMPHPFIITSYVLLYAALLYGQFRDAYDTVHHTFDWSAFAPVLLPLFFFFLFLLILFNRDAAQLTTFFERRLDAAEIQSFELGPNKP